MQMPLEITYRNVRKSHDVITLIDQKIEKLERVCDHIISCHVALESPHAHSRSPRYYRVRVDIRVPPEHELVVTRESSGNEKKTSLSRTVREAFEAMWRQLKTLMEKQRGEVKVHAQSFTEGVVHQLFESDDCGFLKTVDGRDLYFHRNSVLNGGFDHIEIGSIVRYVEEMGEKGPQASTVEVNHRKSQGKTPRGPTRKMPRRSPEDFTSPQVRLNA